MAKMTIKMNATECNAINEAVVIGGTTLGRDRVEIQKSFRDMCDCFKRGEVEYFPGGKISAYVDDDADTERLYVVDIDIADKAVISMTMCVMNFIIACWPLIAPAVSFAKNFKTLLGSLKDIAKDKFHPFVEAFIPKATYGSTRVTIPELDIDDVVILRNNNNGNMPEIIHTLCVGSGRNGQAVHDAWARRWKNDEAADVEYNYTSYQDCYDAVHDDWCEEVGITNHSAIEQEDSYSEESFRPDGDYYVPVIAVDQEAGQKPFPYMFVLRCVSENGHLTVRKATPIGTRGIANSAWKFTQAGVNMVNEAADRNFDGGAMFTLYDDAVACYRAIQDYIVSEFAMYDNPIVQLDVHSGFAGIAVIAGENILSA